MKKNGPTLANLLESFFRHRLVAQRRASPATVATYRDSLKLFLVFASEQHGKPPSRLTVDDLDRDVVLAFLDDLEESRGNSVRTRNARLTAIHSFFQYIGYRDPASMGIVQRILGIQGKRAVKPLIGYLSREELDAILDAPNRSTRQGRRDYALLLFLARTGARASEAVGVNAADLRLNRPCQVTVDGKGSKERAVPLDESTAVVLQALCDERGLHPLDGSPVFVNARGQRLSRYGLFHMVRRAVTIAARTQPMLGKRTISPHTLRHTTAMNLLQSGVDLFVIRSWLGHVSLDTTHQYIEADVEMKRRALEKCGVTEEKTAPYQPADPILTMLEKL